MGQVFRIFDDDRVEFARRKIGDGSCLLIAGSRTLSIDAGRILTVIPLGLQWILTGGAPGVDHQGFIFGVEYGFDCLIFPALWSRYGRRAGPLRNEEMAQVATHAILFWDGVSRGTKSMLELCNRYNLITTVERVDHVPINGGTVGGGAGTH